MKSLSKYSFFVIFTPFITLLGATSLFGCQNEQNAEQICKNNPELCEDLDQGSRCRYEKSDLVRQRYLIKTTPAPSGKMLYDQLLQLEGYSKCIELLSGVQHKVNVHLTSDKLRAHRSSWQNLQQLQQSTKGSSDPYLAYYHWSRLNDHQALNVLLKSETDGELKEPELLSKVANYYLKTDARKANRLYLDVIAMSDPEQLDPELLLGIANGAQRLNEMESVYLFTRAYVLITGQKVDETQMLELLSQSKTRAIELDEQATNLVDSIQDGDFAGSEIEKDWREQWH